MNLQIEKLYRIAQKKERRIIGLMSGTSLDGLDIACCLIQGSGAQTKLFLEDFVSMPYPKTFRKQILEVFSQRYIDQAVLSGLHAHIGKYHARLIKEALAKWNRPASLIDAIASHGQTVFHAPQRLCADTRFPNSTLQLGDADHIAYETGIMTVSDFRQKHLAAGGEGAPLAVYGDYLCYRSENENRILLNIGGISNFTFLPQIGSTLQAYASDIGPGNTLMNQFMLEQYGLEMDENAGLALQGQVDRQLLQALLSHAFFHVEMPKTTGPELFNLDYLKNIQAQADRLALSNADLMATLNRFTAESIALSIRRVTAQLDDIHVYISGGGLHNPLLLKNLQELLPHVHLHSFHKLGLDPDAKEACLFAILANETLAGSPNYVQGILGAPSICMGKISFAY